MALPLTHWRFTVGDYYRMAEAGILTEDDRVELIDGEIVEMPPIGRRHASCVDRTTELFVREFMDVAVIRVQNPVRLGEYTEPQPDVMLLRRRPGLLRLGPPDPGRRVLARGGGGHVVRHGSPGEDPAPRRSGIPEVWLLGLDEDAITLYRDPTSSGYSAVLTARRGEMLAPLAFPDRRLAAGDILGEAQSRGQVVQPPRLENAGNSCRPWLRVQVCEVRTTVRQGVLAPTTATRGLEY